MAIEYELKQPFKVGELDVKKIIIQRPKTKDFIAVGTIPLGSVAADTALLSSLSGFPESVITQIDIDDLSVLRYYVTRIWDSYFSSKPYIENPTIAEETPQNMITEKDTA
ncbi:MAG: phage tail assembly protein [Treponema sp.]|nr:phage tail assembly protein [Treponema sp.]